MYIKEFFCSLWIALIVAIWQSILDLAKNKTTKSSFIPK